MLPTRQGSFRLFRFAGITVYLHWYWFLAAIYEINARLDVYSSILWNVGEYVAFFGIVLLHEFGHALACRQVGGKAEEIILWPLGGVAYVAPPQRPGAMLWSLAAGPLVNVMLVPILGALYLLGLNAGWAAARPDAFRLLYALRATNLVLLFFNLLPIFPLDGGQILRALLWFPLGRARSLMVATMVGFVGVAGLIALALLVRRVIFGLLCLFILLNCWRGLMHARLLARLARMPRHTGFACPGCGQPPICAPIWRCPSCSQGLDPFATQAVCPHCGATFAATLCPDCGAAHPFGQWASGALERA